MKKKALVLLSGGLDSLLALGLMKKQKVELEALSFVSLFSDGIKEGRLGTSARVAAEFFDVPLRFVTLREEYLEMIKNPEFGYGSAFNPCRDCHTLMFRIARELFEKTGASFIATGEVLGERPMSQLKNSLPVIEQRAGLDGLIVRPLSGQLFPPTIPEKEGIINRSLLLDISGRSRKPQIQLAKDFKISSYPQPAGGCILTDKLFGERLKDFFAAGYTDWRQLFTLRWGRHYRLSPQVKCVLGRDERENMMLEQLAGDEDYIMRLRDIPGPSLVVQGTADETILARAAGLVKHFSKARKDKSAPIQLWQKETPETIRIIAAPTMSADDIEKLLIQ